ncbi:hypothetical protein BST61_g6800 [Cercospora zeina]
MLFLILFTVAALGRRADCVSVKHPRIKCSCGSSGWKLEHGTVTTCTLHEGSAKPFRLLIRNSQTSAKQANGLDFGLNSTNCLQHETVTVVRIRDDRSPAKAGFICFIYESNK